MAYIGFSTGALALGNFAKALEVLSGTHMNAIELSALRLNELPVLVDHLSLFRSYQNQYSYVSVHAPSRFTACEESGVVDLLRKVPASWPIILHPDTIHDSKKWAVLGSQLMIENMDRRKQNGCTVFDLREWFEILPEARFCLDLAHAHQYDRTMTEAYRLLMQFKHRIGQLHVSELDSEGTHYPLSYGTIQAFREIAQAIPPDVPAIIESLNPFKDRDIARQQSWIEYEAGRVLESINRKDNSTIPLKYLSGNCVAAINVPA